MNRRDLLRAGAGCLATLPLAPLAHGAAGADTWSLRIVAVRSEIAAGVAVPALAVEVLLPGAGHRLVPVRVRNDTARPVTLRSAWWDGDLRIDPGAHGECRMDLRSGRAALFVSDGRLRGAALLGAPQALPGNVDAEHALCLQHWPMPGAAGYVTLGPQVQAQSEPLRVRAGQRLRFRFFNAGTHEPVSLHLPGHLFEVEALDDVPLGQSVSMEDLALAPGERIDAQVRFDAPGRWVLGSRSRVTQQSGFGRLIEYVGARGAPVTSAPAPVRFCYARLGRPAAPRLDTGESSEIVLDPAPWDRRMLERESGPRRRLVFSNMTGTTQVVALRGQGFELCQSGSDHLQPLRKDTLALRPFARVAVTCEPRDRPRELLRL